MGRAIERGFWSLQSSLWDQPMEGGAHADRIRRLLSWVQSVLRGPGRILDLGCATGEIAVGLSRLGHDVCALDLSPRMLRRARRRPGAEAVRFVEADLAETLSPTLGAFDAVLLFGLLQCVPDPRRVVDEALGRLVPGGLLFVEVKQSPGEEVAGPSRASLAGRLLRAAKSRASRSAWVHRFAVPELVLLLQGANLDVREVDTSGPWIRLLAKRP